MLTPGVRGALGNEQTAEPSEYRSDAGEERQKADTVNMEPKERVQPGSHSNPAPAPFLNKLSGVLLWLSVSLLLPISLFRFFPCAVAWGVVIFSMFHLHRALCVCMC